MPLESLKLLYINFMQRWWRVLRAQAHLRWKCVLWSDESISACFGEKLTEFSDPKKKRTTQMFISDRVCGNSMWVLHMCEGMWRSILEFYRDKIIPSFLGNRWSLQQNKAKPHSAHATTDWLNGQYTCSLDLSSIGNVWPIMKRKCCQVRLVKNSPCKTAAITVVSSIPKRLNG